MTPDFNRLRVFFFVMETGGVSAAAERLHVTQSAVSQHLLKLEQELKTPLFVRLQNRLVPTEAGERLYTVLIPFINSLKGTLAQLDRARIEPFGLLKIGAPVEFGVHYLPGLFASFRKIHPNVRFHLSLGRPDALFLAVQTGRLDMAFADLFSNTPERRREYALFEIDRIMDEALILVCSSSYFNTHFKDELSFSTLSEADFVSYQEDGAAVRSWFRYHYRKIPKALNVAVTVESVQAVVACIREDLGLGVIPLHIVKKELSRGQLIQISNKKTPLSNAISLVRLSDKHPTLAEKAFVSHIKKAVF